MALKKKKLLILINNLSFFCSHRLPITEVAKKKLFNVTIGYGELGGINPDILKKKGYQLFYIPMKRASINFFDDIKSLFYIWHFFIKTKPDIVHLVTIKPYLYGAIIARLVGVQGVVSAISGLGTLFIHKDFKSKILRTLIYPIYRIAFNHPNQKIIFQNSEDARTLIDWGVVNSNKIELLTGSGVNLKDFKNIKEPSGQIIVCFAARLLIDKGVYEYVEAAKILKEKGIKASFLLAGALDPQNPSGLKKADIEQIEKHGIVKIIGFYNDIPLLYSKSNIICLPSYREGLPKSLMEAAAASRAVVTTDVPGCRDAIIPDKTGLIVPVRNSEALASALEDLIRNHKKRKLMGQAGRKLAEKKFNIENIVNEHIKIYKNLLRSYN